MSHMLVDHVVAFDDEPVEEKASPWRRLLSYSITIVVVAFAVYLWPAMLGGSTRLVIVSGTSMEPTYGLRDLVIARDAGDSRVGDIVVFEVPEGQGAGSLVIHRISRIDDEGFFVTQGDNRDTPDQWRLTEDDIVGKPLLRIPSAGTAFGFISDLRVIAALVGVAAIIFLWPEEDEEDDERRPKQRTVGTHTSAAWSSVSTHSVEIVTAIADERRDDDGEDVVGRLQRSWAEHDQGETDPSPEPTATGPEPDADEWVDARRATSIDDAMMADAMAWLDAQLADSANDPTAR